MENPLYLQTAISSFISSSKINSALSHTKVCNLGIHVRIQQDVLRLQVSVHHHVSVTVIHPRDDLLKQTPALLLIQLTPEKHNKTELCIVFITHLNEP